MTREKQFSYLLLIALGWITGGLAMLLMQYGSMLAGFITFIVIGILIYCAFIFPSKNAS